MKKGMVYSGTFMGILYGLGALWDGPGVRWTAASDPRCSPPCCSGPWRSRCSRRSSRRSTAASAFFRRVGKSYRNPLLYARGAVVGLGLGYGLTLGLSGQDDAGAGPGSASASGPRPIAGIDLAPRRLRGVAGPGPGPVVAGLPGAGAAGRLHRRGDRVLPRRRPGRRGRRQVPSLPRRGHGAASPSTSIRSLSKWGLIDLGTVTGGVSLLFAEALAGVISWSIRRLALRDQPDVHGGLLPEGGDADPGALHAGRAGPAHREHDPGPPLGPLDVADHQLLPAADGRADLVQPGRRDPHRAGDLPGRRR